MKTDFVFTKGRYRQKTLGVSTLSSLESRRRLVKCVRFIGKVRVTILFATDGAYLIARRAKERRWHEIVESSKK